MRRLAALAAALTLGWGAAASAQESLGEYDAVLERLGGVLASCLQASSSREGDGLCARRIEALCAEEGPGGNSTYGLAACSAVLTRLWDDELNRLWPSALAAQGEGGGERLRDAQRAWIAFRDAECLFEAARWEGGSMGAYAGGFCLAGMTAERVADLRDLQRGG